MHIPDGFLSPPVWGTCFVAAAAGVAYAAKKSQDQFDEKAVPLTGIVCAFIFAAQMINFPVMAGTSGHLLGGVLATVLLGPWVASLVLALVLIVQCFIFQDGGVSVLGANIINMAFGGVWGGYALFVLLRSFSPKKWMFLTATAVASWASVLIASACCAVQIGLSGTYPLGLTLKAMLLVHAIIGIGEAIITTAVVVTVLNTRRDLVSTYKEELI
ncbi:MAG: energy-coupling factor ABC transporter permease [bacterium]|jgi:cobalt/nickel transport system permease protein|nr:energy-coupling factor ABC transporter permease [bacterium]